MLNSDFTQAIAKIGALMGKRMVWAVVGSTNLALQRVQVSPNDIDILVFLPDLRPARDLFRDFSPSVIAQGRGHGNDIFEFKMRIGSVPVHVFGEHESGYYARKLFSGRYVNVRVGEFVIPCFTLEAEAQAYDETGRRDKADAIRDFLKKHADD